MNTKAFPPPSSPSRPSKPGQPSKPTQSEKDARNEKVPSSARPGKRPTISRPHDRTAKPKAPTMILVPDGWLIMGTSEEQVQQLILREEWATEWYNKDLFLVEQPQHDVFVPGFKLARFPVTNFEYHMFVWATNHRAPKEWFGFHFPDGEGEHPVVGISKEDAESYCAWLTRQVYGPNPTTVLRLPSEAEWEHAARGDDDRIYPWGNEFDPWRCNTIESGKRGTTVIGGFCPGGDSPFGHADMAGNVWEWTSSFLEDYPYDSEDGREDPNHGGNCVIRGGSWYYSRKLARCSCRESVLATFTSLTLGFRVACTPAEMELPDAESEDE